MSKKTLLLATLLLLLAAFAWTRNRIRHFIGHHDWDNVTWVVAAENYERYGLLETRFQQIINAYPVSKEDWTAYSNHPPGISFITLISQNLFGASEFAARLSPIFASLLAAALLFLIARKLYDEDTALLALFFFILMPIMVYYSAKIGHEQFTLPLMFMMIILYRYWLIQPSAKLLGYMAVLAILGGFISWAWYLFLGILAFHVWWWHKNFFSIWHLWPVWVGATFSLLILISSNLWYDANYLQQLREAFLIRTVNEGNEKSINILQWIIVAGASFLWLPTPVVTILTLYSLKKSLKRFATPHKSVLMLAIITGLAYALIFWQGTYIHDYYIYYIAAILPITAAIGYQSLLYQYKKNPPKTWKYLLSTLLLLFIVGSIRWSISLFTKDIGEQRYTWGILAGQQTEPGEIILSNLPDYGPHISYYARRKVIYEIEPEQIVQSTHPKNWGFYIYCVAETADFNPENFPASYTYDDTAKCYLIDLKP